MFKLKKLMQNATSFAPEVCEVERMIIISQILEMCIFTHLNEGEQRESQPLKLFLHFIAKVLFICSLNISITFTV